MTLLLLFALAAQAGAGSSALLPSFETQVEQEVDQARYWALDEDADEASFSLGGIIPLPNFHEVIPGIYRSGQPNREGLAMLKALGVKTILVLRMKVGREELEEARRLGIQIESIPMNGVFSPSFDKVDRALSILGDAKRRPILVHCRYGKDRTGVTIAALRTALQSWDIPRAAAEARSYGCCTPLFRKLETYLADYLKHRAN